MKNCNVCNGTGRKVSFANEILDDNGILFEHNACEVCQGTGKLEEIYYKWYNEMISFMSNYCDGAYVE